MTHKPDLTGVSSHPGVYLMKDKGGEILYVGKAKNLKKRVSSYFRNLGTGLANTKTRVLVEKIVSVETIVVHNEIEALVLENELIKKHRPPYNILLRDDKNYLYIRVTMQDEFPRILLARKVAKDGAKYFGPFTESRAVYGLLKLVKKIFPICTASTQITEEKIKKGRMRPCLNYHLGICPGVCVGKITSAEYKQIMSEVSRFIGGDYDQVLRQLKGQMAEASVKKEFERAAKYRDSIQAVERIATKQVVVTDIGNNADVLGVARQLNKVVVALLSVRYGKLLNSQTLVMESGYEAEDPEVVSAFIRDYYAQVGEIPANIYIPVDIEDAVVLMEWLREAAGRKVNITSPSRGEKKELLDIARQNAQLKLGDLAVKLNLERKGTQDGVAQLKELLRLEKLDRIEAYDISNTQGVDSVGSMVVWEKGSMNKSQYRRFKIKTVEGPNDFASLAEVLTRRFAPKRASEEAGQRVGGDNTVFARKPDLILIDGGKGQVNTVVSALGKTDIRIIGMAKADHSAPKAKDDIVLPGVSAPIVLPTNSPAKYLLQNIRDEAHRFALGLHTHLARKKVRESELEKIPGVGEATRKKLIKKFGSMAGVKRASVEEVAEVVGAAKARQILGGL